MNEITTWILVIVGISIPPVLAVLLNHLFQKKKIAAETEKIRLENKIAKDITYNQLKSESKHKDVKNKIDILQKLVILEEEIKSKESKSSSDQKKLESLEMIKKEFTQSFAEENEERPHLEGKKENLASQEKKVKEIRKPAKNTKTNLKKKNKK